MFCGQFRDFLWEVSGFKMKTSWGLSLVRWAKQRRDEDNFIAISTVTILSFKYAKYHGNSPGNNLRINDLNPTLGNL